MKSGWQFTPEGRRIMAILYEMNDREVHVGFVDGKSYEIDKKHKSSVSIAQVAAWNEYGTIHIPARPFMRDAIEFNQDKIQNHLSKHVRSIMQTGNGSAQQTLSSIGTFTQRLIQKEIKDGMWIPNAPSTIRMKKSDRPLIDTGRMRQSVTFVIK